VPCYRCGVRQTDPERGKSPWRRGVVREQLVLICPACQESTDWTADLEHCSECRSAHLIRRLGQVECLDCGLVREPETGLLPVGAEDADGRASTRADAALADEVGRALDRLLGRR
jgi:fatty acid/phospholipid biosynthesis enzyme